MDKMENDKFFHVHVEANIDIPYKWVVWAYSKQDAWAEKREGILK